MNWTRTEPEVNYVSRVAATWLAPFFTKEMSRLTGLSSSNLYAHLPLDLVALWILCLRGCENEHTSCSSMYPGTVRAAWT